MPLTFAHPAVVLPFSRNSSYINFSALVLGSMAPDFEYFLKGKPSAEIGHTYIGFITFNLPIVIIVYFLYKWFIHEVLNANLPTILQIPAVHKKHSPKFVSWFVFLYSALFGMFTHVAWDSFTHAGGRIVRSFSLFTYQFSIFGVTIPLYKLFQHGSTLVGICTIFLYMFFNARKNKRKNSVYPLKKWRYWMQIAVLSFILFSLWIVLDRVSIHAYGILVVRMIDSALISLLIVSLFETYKQVPNVVRKSSH
ncbi:DUF4184 domain-containing protein [Lysinibacillus sp. 2017]|uniref:DUF4184 family protein n=1 Tax=unclassified Lysinibacillus TaxID=2636778 RepID=UPI000D52778A|nr:MULTISPECIES: DUF4184 family protein [unclassified Lysinibacillus]AWE07440.1 DUF4184 domain-containing protein [Lysinibacillus sp. 2017]TGN36605.1 DUF4184 family protein [Lysinibacillus sp. S2017]